MDKFTLCRGDKDQILIQLKANIFEILDPYVQNRINDLVDTHNKLVHASNIYNVYVGTVSFTKVVKPQLILRTRKFKVGEYQRSDNLHESLHEEAQDILQIRNTRDILKRRFDIYLTRVLNAANTNIDVEALTPHFLKQHLVLPVASMGETEDMPNLTKKEIDSFKQQNISYYKDLKDHYMSIMLLSGLG